MSNFAINALQARHHFAHLAGHLPQNRKVVDRFHIKKLLSALRSKKIIATGVLKPPGTHQIDASPKFSPPTHMIKRTSEFMLSNGEFDTASGETSLE